MKKRASIWAREVGLGEVDADLQNRVEQWWSLRSTSAILELLRHNASCKRGCCMVNGLGVDLSWIGEAGERVRRGRLK